MIDELITREVAILAKEKGFDEVCYFLYDLTFREEIAFENGKFHRNSKINIKFADKTNFVTAPTQTSIQRWLREKYNIHFIIINLQNSDDYEISVVQQPGYLLTHIDRRDTYEKILELGLLEGLKLIDNQNERSSSRI